MRAGKIREGGKMSWLVSRGRRDEVSNRTDWVARYVDEMRWATFESDELEGYAAAYGEHQRCSAMT